MVSAYAEAFTHAVGLAISLLIVAYPVYQVVSLLLEGEISSLECAIYLSALFGFIVGIVSTWGSGLSLLLVGMLVVLSFGYRFVAHAVESRKLWAMDQQKLKQYEETIERVPENRRSYERAMQILRRRGDYERAAEYAERYLDVVGSDRGFEKRLEMLKRLIRQKEGGIKICPACGGENPPGTGTCIYCGRVMTLPSDLVAGCRTDIGMQASLLTAATLLVAAIVVTVIGANQLIAGSLFLGAFSTFFFYLYVRYH